MTKRSTRYDRVLTLQWYVSVYVYVYNALDADCVGSCSLSRGEWWVEARVPQMRKGAGSRRQGEGRKAPQRPRGHCGRATQHSVEFSTELGIGAIIKGPHACSGTRSECLSGPWSVAICRAIPDRRAGFCKILPRLSPKAPPANLTRGRGVYLALRVRSPSVNK